MPKGNLTQQIYGQNSLKNEKKDLNPNSSKKSLSKTKPQSKTSSAASLSKNVDNVGGGDLSNNALDKTQEVPADLIE